MMEEGYTNFYSSVAVGNVQTVQFSQKLHILGFKQFSIVSRFNVLHWV